MLVRELGEDALVARLREVFHTHQSRITDVLVPNGDDGAVITPRGKSVVLSTDIATQGVHFRSDWSMPFEIGGKITVANLSDIAAMGGTPKFLLVGLALTGEEEIDWVLELARGIQTIAESQEVAVIGGDVVRGQSISISITAYGECETPVLRSGAQVGDQVVLTSISGFSRAGYLILEKFGRDSDEARKFKSCVDAHLLPKYQGASAKLLASLGARAMCDVSDGLAIDLERLAKASGVGIELDISVHALSPLSRVADFLETSPLNLFLNSGEEHLFLGILSQSEEIPGGMLKIGKTIAGDSVTLKGNSKIENENFWKHW